MRPRIFGTLERVNRCRVRVIEAVESRHAAESIQERNSLSKVRNSHTDANLRPQRSRINVHRVFASLRKVLFPLQIASDTDIPNRERNARSHLELTRYGVAEIALVYSQTSCRHRLLG